MIVNGVDTAKSTTNTTTPTSSTNMIDYNGFLQGCIGTMAAIRALRNEKIVTEVVLKPTVVNASNYQPYDQPLEARTCPSWSEVEAFSTKTN